MTENLLEIVNLDTYYGAVHAVRNVSLCLKKNEIVTLLGSNGAGKTSLLKSIMQMVPYRQGIIRFEGRDLSKYRTDQLVKAGLAMVPEGRGILLSMSVRENLELGAYHRSRWENELAGIFSLFPVLKDRFEQSAGTLSGGEQQMLAIARALLSKPRVLLLDEPSLGLAPKVIQRIFELIAEIKSQGVSILLVEQNAHMALKVADRVYCLEVGGVTIDGKSKDETDITRLQESYLGG